MFQNFKFHKRRKGWRLLAVGTIILAVEVKEDLF